MRFGSLAFVLGLTANLTAVASDPAPVAEAKAATPGAPATRPAPVRVISGTVSGAEGKPVNGATVRAIPMPLRADPSVRGNTRSDPPKAVVVRTDATGAFRLELGSGSPAAVRVEAPGFAPASASDVSVGTVLNVRMKPGVAVVGRVLDLMTQRPVANATVTGLERDAARFGRESAQTVASADDGTFRLRDCAPGLVVVEAIAPGKARGHLDRVVAKPAVAGEEPKPEANTIYLQPGGRIAGRVVGPDGKPLADAIVTATASDGKLFAMMRDGRSVQRSDATGTFVFDGVVAGNKYTVRATKAGLASREEGPIPIEAGTDRGDLELRLESGAGLTFRLVTAKDVPVKNVEARLVSQGAGRRRGMGFGANDVDKDKIVSQGEGQFFIKSLDAGVFDLTLQPTDFADVTREGVKLRSGETTDLGTLRVTESKSISGRITDTSGRRVEGAAIYGLSIEGEVRLSREAHSGPDGRYRLSGLGDQPVRSLTVRAEGYADASSEGATPGDSDVDFTLEKTGSIVGRVQLRGGAVPPAFRVQASPEAKEKQERTGMRIVVGGRQDEEQVFTDPSGNFRLDGVAPGFVTITAKADGKAPARKTGLKVVSEQVVDVSSLVLEDGHTLRGRVVAAKDEAPIAGATVSVSPPQGLMVAFGRDTAVGFAISALDGRFEIAGLEPRTYAIDASQPEYSPNTGRVEIGADADTDDFVVKLSRGGTITGLVRDAQKVAVPNSPVLLAKIPMGSGPQTVSSGPDGRYTFEKVPPGEYMVIRAPAGGGPLILFGGMKQVVVREGETTFHDIDESAKITLTGRVQKGGQPVANAMIFFSSGEGGGMPTDLKQSRTDADGRYQIGLDASGTYMVAVSSSGGMIGGRQTGVKVLVPDEPNPVVDVTLKSSGISGRIVNVDNKPVSGALVSVRKSGATAGADGHVGGGMQGQSNPDGSFLIDGLEPGTYRVAVVASGYRNVDVPPVTIANDSDVPALDIRLEPGRTLRGHVLDASGNGIAGAMVMAAASGTLPSGRDALQASSDVNGTFVMTIPAEGPIDVTAVAAGFPPARAVSIQPEDGVDVTLRAPRPGHVRVTVLDVKGAPVSGARVTCRAVPDYLGAGYQTFSDQTLPTGTDGVTTVMSLAPGGYELVVASGSKRMTQAVTLSEGAEVVANVMLQ